MTHAVDLALAVLTVGAFLYIALGAWVLTLTPRRRQTVLLGAFAVLFGLQFATVDVLLILDLIDPWSLAHATTLVPFAVLSHSLAFALAWSVPEPLEDRRPLGIALVAGLGLGFVSGASLLGVGRIGGVAVAGATGWMWAAFFTSFGILGAAGILLALRGRPGRGADRGTVTQLALLTVALGLLLAVDSGAGIPDSARALAAGDPALVLSGLSGAALWLVVAGLWGWNMLRADEETVGIHRAAMLGILGLLAAGAVYSATVPSAESGTTVARGIARTLGVAVLAYGILRHDLAGLDAKVEWTVSKTTVAGIFVAVFFIVSEGAQVLFAGFARSELLGIVAAGALLFVLSPIQRAADRIAERAVPGSPDGEGPGDPEALYRSTAARFLADGELTEDEEEMLAQLATRLGIDASRAFELRREARSDREGGDAP